MILDALSLHILAQAAEGGASSTMIVVIIVVAVVLGLIVFLVTRGGKGPEAPKATPPKEGESEEKPSTNLLEDRMEVDAPVEIHDGMSLAEIKRAKAARVRRKDGARRETAVEATERSKVDHGVEGEAESVEKIDLEETSEPAADEEVAVDAEDSSAVAEGAAGADAVDAADDADVAEEADETDEADDDEEVAEALEEAAESKDAPKKLPKPSLPDIGGLPAPSEASEVAEDDEDDESKPSKLPKPKLGKLPKPKKKLPETPEAEDEAAAEAPTDGEEQEPAPEPADEPADERADAPVEASKAAPVADEPEADATPEPAEDQAEVPAEEQEVAQAKTLEDGLAKTRTGFIQRLSGLFQKETLDDDIVEEVEEVLFTADIGPSAAQKIMNALEEELEKDEKNDPSAVWRFVRSYVEELLASREETLDVGTHQPFVMLVIGVNGVGKTTTIGKMASKYKRQGKSVLMVAGDTFRAAAVEQLEVWGERTGIDVYKGKEEQDPASVVYEGVEKAVKDEIDVVICDTAGRLQTNVNLLDELGKMSRVAGKVVEGSPHETILVLDANTGQNAIQQAKLFNEAVDISGIVLTKLDGTAKGGVILGICDEIDAPIRYIGIGEGVADLREFDSGEFVEALFM